jgi:formate hydrogenlyase subunit 6/NADH:ubiquinone oxidoreductase subunit I
MFSWVRKGVGTGIVTTRYPHRPEPMPDAFRGRPLLDAERCQAAQGCSACVQVCLPGALSVLPVATDGQGVPEASREQFVLDYGRCIMCGLCVSACPFQALSMTTDYELATTTAEDLRITVSFPESAPQNHRQEEH